MEWASSVMQTRQEVRCQCSRRWVWLYGLPSSALMETSQHGLHVSAGLATLIGATLRCSTTRGVLARLSMLHRHTIRSAAPSRHVEASFVGSTCVLVYPTPADDLTRPSNHISKSASQRCITTFEPDVRLLSLRRARACCKGLLYSCG